MLEVAEGWAAVTFPGPGGPQDATNILKLGITSHINSQTICNMI